MPIPMSRDREKLVAHLENWFAERGIFREGEAHISGLSSPEGVGNANETYLMDLTRTEGSESVVEELVLRVAPTTYSLFMDADFCELSSLLNDLNRSASFPVPAVRWLEPDETVIGAPFCIMEKASGRVPPDNAGPNWVLDLSLEQQLALWSEGFQAMCSIHTTGNLKEAEGLLSDRLSGRSGVEEQLDYWDRYRQWAGLEDERMSSIYYWLVRHVPKATATSLSWGDARLENMVFDESLHCTAILDWEMVNLGGPLMDLSWWIVYYKSFEAISGAVIPPAYPQREIVISEWLRITGIETNDLSWYEVFSALRLGEICARVTNVAESMGSPMPRDIVTPVLAIATEVIG